MPRNKEQACSFLQDSRGYLSRYKLMEDTIWETSRFNRFKSYIDLRTALECVQKSATALYIHDSLEGEVLYKKFTSYSHRVDKTHDILIEKLDMPSFITSEMENIKQLPYAVKYTLDGVMFYDAYEDLYYKTIGSDCWMDALYESIETLINIVSTKIGPSEIINSSDMFEELSRSTYNRYL